MLDKKIESLWDSYASELSWFKKWEKIREGEFPFVRWFEGGELNASYLCLDQHVKTEKKDKIAIHWSDEEGNKENFTYFQLYERVNKLAASLKKLGIKKGDVVILYLPMIPQAIISILAVTRIGAIHSVVFSGFSSKALQDRIDDTQAKFVITADFGIRRGKKIPLKACVDVALQNSSSVQKVVVVKRFDTPLVLQDGRDVLYQDLMSGPLEIVEPEKVESNHPLFILYTSGTTGKPKGIMHSTGGYLVYAYATFKQCFDMQKDSVYWCTADIGWITGHSYVIYAPLMHGLTQVIYEGAPDYPDPSIWWKTIDEYKVSVFYTSPTAIRMFMQFGDSVLQNCNLSSLKVLGSVGEVLNPEVWHWFFNTIGKGRCSIIDTWWQTETGGFMIAPKKEYSVSTLRPGSVTFPLAGIDPEILDENGDAVSPGQKGYLVMKEPWPGMMLGIYNDNEKYVQTYWSKFPEKYYSGDYAIKDMDGYFWILGRSDEVLKIAGHRIGTAEIESAVVANSFVAEAAAIGVPDPIKGEGFVIFVILKKEFENQDFGQAINRSLKEQIGSLAKPQEIYFVKGLPKTRSGKILRRVLKSIILHGNEGDLTTLEDNSIIEEIKQKCRDFKAYSSNV
jgi:acetyl-CoA synthetase